MKSWQVQEAKMKLSDLISMSKFDPQLITVRGYPTAIVLSTQAYEKLQKPNLSLLEIMQKFPDKNCDFVKTRSRDKKLRKISL